MSLKSNKFLVSKKHSMTSSKKIQEDWCNLKLNLHSIAIFNRLETKSKLLKKNSYEFNLVLKLSKYSINIGKLQCYFFSRSWTTSFFRNLSGILNDILEPQVDWRDFYNNKLSIILSLPLSPPRKIEVETKVHLHHLNFHLVEMNFGLFLMKS